MRTLSVLFVSATLGCGGSVAPNQGTPVVDSGAPDAVVVDSAPAVDTRPPEPTTTRWFAVRKLYLGLTTRAGVSSFDAWKQYGYDLDSRTTTREDSKTSLNSCIRVAGSPTNVLTDGDLGRDNNFGQHFMSVVKSLKADAEDAVNASINDGLGTILLRLENVTTDDNPSVPGAIYIASTRGAAPKWDGTDAWPVEESSLMGTEPRIKFPKGSMKGGIWTSGELGSTNGELPLPLIAATTWVPVESAMISFNVNTGKDGTMAGGAPTDKFEKAIAPAFASVGICPGSATYDQIIQTMKSSADLKSGAPKLQDTTQECDTMSIGIGFDVTRALSPDGVSPTKTFPDECGS